MEKAADPGKYNMVFCPVCNGEGKLSKGLAGSVVCKECGGFGLIKKKFDIPGEVEDR